MAKIKHLPDLTGNNRDTKGRFLQGVSGNPEGRPLNSISIMAEIKRNLLLVSGGQKKTNLQLLVELIFKKIIKEEDSSMVKFIISQVDGLPVRKIEGGGEYDRAMEEKFKEQIQAIWEILDRAEKRAGKKE